MINLVPDKIDLFFEDKDDQSEVFLGLYKFVFPEWDNIESINGYPTISNATSQYIFERFIAFDKIFHPDVMAGGLWMNRGFSIDHNMPDWKVYLDECEVIYKVL